MSTITLIIIAVAILFFGARVKASMSKVLDLVDDGLDVAQAHTKAMREDAELSAQLNSMEKREELQKRLNKHAGKTGTDAITLESLATKK